MCRKLLGVIGYEEEHMDPPATSPERVTQLLAHWSHGDDAALGELTPLVYEELRRLAHYHMGGERPDHTLQTTALVNEAYLRLADQANPRLAESRPFFRGCRESNAAHPGQLRQEFGAQKRGGGALKVELDEAALFHPEESKKIVDLHEALESLARLDARKARVVELKYFGGLNHDEIAEVLKSLP